VAVCTHAGPTAGFIEARASRVNQDTIERAARRPGQERSSVGADGFVRCMARVHRMMSFPVIGIDLGGAVTGFSEAVEEIVAIEIDVQRPTPATSSFFEILDLRGQPQRCGTPRRRKCLLTPDGSNPWFSRRFHAARRTRCGQISERSSGGLVRAWRPWWVQNASRNTTCASRRSLICGPAFRSLRVFFSGDRRARSDRFFPSEFQLGAILDSSRASRATSGVRLRISSRCYLPPGSLTLRSRPGAVREAFEFVRTIASATQRGGSFGAAYCLTAFAYVSLRVRVYRITLVSTYAAYS